MSALGQKQTFALQQAMSALHPIATSIAFFGMFALGQKQTFGSASVMSGLGSEQTLMRDAYRSSSTPRITGTHVPPIWVAITLPELLSALAMSQLGRPISMP
jgi:hypothetical protein